MFICHTQFDKRDSGENVVCARESFVLERFEKRREQHFNFPDKSPQNLGREIILRTVTTEAKHFEFASSKITL